ncbi:MAG TPA: hypothetical protein VKS79_21170 [Gemmataceae bacterium]|nr:hypothetical protein [Gemmataceae bacterium]
MMSDFAIVRQRILEAAPDHPLAGFRALLTEDGIRQTSRRRGLQLTYAPPPRRDIICRHAGDVLDHCPLGQHDRDLLECDLHGTCTRELTSRKTALPVARCCRNCPDYEPDPLLLPKKLPPPTPQTPVAELIDRLDGDPPSDWPHGWQDWDNVKQAHWIKAWQLLGAMPAYPEGRWRGRGVVISGGGKYWPSAYVSARMVRALGCTLPIQIWYLGDGERDQRFEDLLRPLGIECIDAQRHRLDHPYRRLGGYESKFYAVWESPFEEVLLLDADCYPVVDPTPLFDRADYRASGAVYFPDISQGNGWTNWNFWNVAKFGPECGLETGQYFFHKRVAWEPANLIRFYEQHSDWCYGQPKGDNCKHGGHGDTGPHRVAWAQLQRRFTIWFTGSAWQRSVFLHRGPESETLFVHRMRNKFKLAPERFYTPQDAAATFRDEALPGEALAWGIFEELKHALA